jgi:hypothetical protein
MSIVEDRRFPWKDRPRTCSSLVHRTSQHSPRTTWLELCRIRLRVAVQWYSTGTVPWWAIKLAAPAWKSFRLAVRTSRYSAPAEACTTRSGVSSTRLAQGSQTPKRQEMQLSMSCVCQIYSAGWARTGVISYQLDGTGDAFASRKLHVERRLEFDAALAGREGSGPGQLHRAWPQPVSAANEEHSLV